MADRKRIPIEQRYWSKVDRSGGPDACWPWVASRNRGGYGQFWPGTYSHANAPDMTTAHRWAFQHFIRSLRANECVLHRCDNPPCQNPDHWFIGTHKDNAEDRQRKGRGGPGGTPRYGEENGSAKLNAQQVAEIRTRYSTGSFSHRQLALSFGVSRPLIHAILHRKLWRDVP